MAKRTKKPAAKVPPSTASAAAAELLDGGKHRHGHKALRALDDARLESRRSRRARSRRAGSRAGHSPASHDRTHAPGEGAGAEPALARELWKEEPDEHDFPAARDYLGLLLADAGAASAVAALERAPLVRCKAKDLLRASRLALLPLDDPAVARDLAKARAGERLSPVLALRGRLGTDVPLTVADGYHRICASYHLDENAEIPCRLGDIARR